MYFMAFLSSKLELTKGLSNLGQALFDG